MSRILVIDDDEIIRYNLSIFLGANGFLVSEAKNGTEGIECVQKFDPDIVICDIRMPDINGLQVLEEIKVLRPSLQVILMTAHDDVSTTIKAMQKGAYDFVSKPLDLSYLKIKIQKALDLKHTSQRLADVIDEDTQEYSLENRLIGKSPVMKEIYKYIGQLSTNKVTVLINGDSGTGKELVARILHYSQNPDKPFVAVNCTAIAENLLESEMFGHVKGAFTGAIQDKRGKFELAGEGTIFLDEISELSFHLQGKLLRVLQEKEFEKVGGETTLKVNSRVIAATNKDLQKLVEDGKFREDLYYRLKVFTINMPSLSERKEDIPLLVTHFMKRINVELHKKVKKIPSEVMEMLQEYNWTGNVRELENTLKQALVLCKDDVLDKEYILLKRDKKVEPDLYTAEINIYSKLDDVEKDHIKKVINHFNWSIKDTCISLGITKPTLYAKLKKYKIEKNLSN